MRDRQWDEKLNRYCRSTFRKRVLCAALQPRGLHPTCVLTRSSTYLRLNPVVLFRKDAICKIDFFIIEGLQYEVKRLKIVVICLCFMEILFVIFVLPSLGETEKELENVGVMWRARGICINDFKEEVEAVVKHRTL